MDPMNESAHRILVLAIGNPLMGDDALGLRLLERLSGSPWTLEHAYQLQIEHAADWAAYSVVVVVDAAMGQQVPALFSPVAEVEVDAREGLSSHRLEPPVVLALHRAYFEGTAKVFVLSMAAEGFELGAPLSSIGELALVAGEALLMQELARLTEVHAPREH